MNFSPQQEWPLTSKLDPKIYGPAESAITKEIVEKEIGGFMTVEEVNIITILHKKKMKWNFFTQSSKLGAFIGFREEEAIYIGLP